MDRGRGFQPTDVQALGGGGGAVRCPFAVCALARWDKCHLHKASRHWATETAQQVKTLMTPSSVTETYIVAEDSPPPYVALKLTHTHIQLV